MYKNYTPMNMSPQERKQGMSTAATKLVIIIGGAGDRSLVENDLHRCLKQIIRPATSSFRTVSAYGTGTLGREFSEPSSRRHKLFTLMS